MSAPTINGLLLTSAAITLPRWGIWTADVEVSVGNQLSGQVQLDVGGLQLTGTIKDGAPYREVGWYRIEGGAGGWRKTIPAKHYRREAGVKLANVVQDAARECGETVGTVPPTLVGPAFCRLEAEAASALADLAPEAWYVDEAGVTQFGARAAAAFAAEYTLLLSAPDRRFVTVSAEDISKLVPGAIIEGLEASSVRHELTTKGLRSHVFGTYADVTDRIAGAFKRLIQALLGRHTDFHRLLEYRVTKVSAGYLDLQPAHASMKLPIMANVQTWGGMGAGGDPTIGSTCLVGFVNGDPCRPAVLHYEGEAGGAWKPSEVRIDATSLVKLGGGTEFVSRADLTDAVFDAVQSAFGTHTHATDGAVSLDHGFVPSSTAAAKVKAT